MITTAARIVRQTDVEYHSDRKRVSRSQLVDFIRSPNLYYKRHVQRTWPQEVTEDMVFGTQFHGVVLEGKSLDDFLTIIPDYVLNDQGHRKGAAWKEWAERNPGVSYKRDEVADKQQQIDEMLRSISCNPAANDLIHGEGHPVLLGESPVEVGIHWERNGIELRTRLDLLLSDCIVDLKTARNCELQKINSSIENDGYYLQAATYQMAVEELTGDVLPFKFVFTEKAIPFRTVVVPVDQTWIAEGRAEIESALHRLQACFDSGNWSDPSTVSEIPMKRPEWVYKYKWNITESE